MEPDTQLAIADLYRRIEELGTASARSGLSSIGHSRTHGIDDHVPRNNFSATAAPAVGDDSADGYGPGSIWVDTTNDRQYICLDGTMGAAVWSETTASVTLAADADTLLSLSSQELGLDTQTANRIFAGPASGAAADPTFRAMVDADIPAAIARDSELHAQAHGPAQHTEGTAWRVVYQDVNGDEQEIVLGALGTVLTSNGAASAPSFQTGGDVPTVVRKTADETVNNSTAFQNDNDLFFAMAANTTYEIELFLLVVSDSTADFKMAFTLPAGANMIWFHVQDASIDAFRIASLGTAAQTISIVGSTDEHAFWIKGIVRCATFAGNLQLQWAQNTATVVNTTVYANSVIKYWAR